MSGGSRDTFTVPVDILIFLGVDTSYKLYCAPINLIILHPTHRQSNSHLGVAQVFIHVCSKHPLLFLSAIFTAKKSFQYLVEIYIKSKHFELKYNGGFRLICISA